MHAIPRRGHSLRTPVAAGTAGGYNTNNCANHAYVQFVRHVHRQRCSDRGRREHLLRQISCDLSTGEWCPHVADRGLRSVTDANGRRNAASLYRAGLKWRRRWGDGYRRDPPSFSPPLDLPVTGAGAKARCCGQRRLRWNVSALTAHTSFPAGTVPTCLPHVQVRHRVAQLPLAVHATPPLPAGRATHGDSAFITALPAIRK